MWIPTPEDDLPEDDGDFGNHWDDEWPPYDELPALPSMGSGHMLPEEESEWLDYLAYFEDQLTNSRRVPLREYLDYPDVQPFHALSAEHLRLELDRLLDLMAAHGIFLEVLAEVEESQLYRFITEELLDEEVDDVRIEGLNQHFIYEEFYPNDVYDAKCWAVEYLIALFTRDLESLQVVCSEDGMLDHQGNAIDADEHTRSVRAFWQRNPAIIAHDVEALAAVVEGDHARVTVGVTWKSIIRRPVDLVTFTGRAEVRLKRSPYYGWDVVAARVPGWCDVRLTERPIR